MKTVISRLRTYGAYESSKKILRKARSRILSVYAWLYRPSFSDKKLLDSLDHRFVNANKIVTYFVKREEPSFIFSVSDKEGIVESLKQHYPETIRSTLERADKICRHEFDLLGHEWEFGTTIDWHLDLMSGKSWPRKYWALIDYSSSKRLGDIKFAWELSKHQYWVVLGKAYWLTGDEAYAKEFTAQMLDWVRSNPQEIGVNWVSGLLLSQQIVSWVMAYEFFKESKSFDQQAQVQFFKSLLSKTRFIYRKLSNKREDVNNHLLGEAATLVLVGLMYPEFKVSDSYLREGVHILENEIEHQLFEDGLSKEQSMSYHRFVIDFLLLIVVVARQNQISISKLLEAKLEKMLEVVMYTTRPDGQSPMFGDSGDERGFILSNIIDFWDFRGWLAAGAVLFSRGDMKHVSGEINEEAFWLLGPKALNKFKKIEAREPREGSVGLEKSGVYVIRDGWSSESRYFVFKCHSDGLGNTGISSHGHSDWLSFELCIGKTPMIIDIGTYAYNLDHKWRNYFRGAHAHNTVLVDGRDHAKPIDIFTLQTDGVAKCTKWVTSESYDYLEAYHTGYLEKSGVTHIRKTLFVKPRYWIVEDTIMGEGTHTADMILNFAVGLKPKRVSSTSKAVIVTDREDALLIFPQEPNRLNVRLEKGSTEPIQGWVSHSYGQKREAYVATFGQNGKASLHQSTILYPISTKLLQKPIDDSFLQRIAETAKVDWLNFAKHDLKRSETRANG